MKKYVVRISLPVPVPFPVEAENEEEAKKEALHDFRDAYLDFECDVERVQEFDTFIPAQKE